MSVETLQNKSYVMKYGGSKNRLSISHRVGRIDNESKGIEARNGLN